MASKHDSYEMRVVGIDERVVLCSTLPNWALTAVGLSGGVARDRERFHELIAAVLWSIALHESERRMQAA